MKNIYNTLFIVIGLIFILSSRAYSTKLEELERLKKTYDIYDVYKGETLVDVAKNNQNINKARYQSLDDYMKAIKKWNPHVKDWKKLVGEQLYIFYPYAPHTGIKWAPNLAKYKEHYEFDYLDEEYHRSSRFLYKNLHMFSFFTVSQGTFVENVGKSDITFDQNSPMTLGVGFAYQMRSRPTLSISTSAYYSNLTAAGVASSTGPATQLEIPPEIGMTFYFQKNYQSIFSNIYTGFDLERFTTFNIIEQLNGEEDLLAVKENRLLYLTAGFGLRFHILSTINMKFSISKGVYASGDLNGLKGLLYFNQKIGSRFWYHILYKQHALTGDKSELSVSRLGFGVGMSLF